MLSTPLNKVCLVFLFITSFVITANNSFAQETISSKGKMSLLQEGVIAPINQLKSIDNQNVTFPINNRWNLIFYWSLFCHSCIEEMPEIQGKLQQLKGKDLNCYFISLDTNKMEKALKNFAKKRKFTSPILMEETEKDKYLTADKWGVTMTPSVFIVNPEGKIVYSHEGPIDLEVFFKNLPESIVGSTN